MPTLTEVDRLHALAAEIRETHEEASKYAEQTRKVANKAITAALLCGKALNEAKELIGHGNWLPWLKEHASEISDRTARRYMALSNRTDLSNLTDCANLHQAYLAAGIISEPETATTTKPQTEKETPCQQTLLNDSRTPSDDSGESQTSGPDVNSADSPLTPPDGAEVPLLCPQTGPGDTIQPPTEEAPIFQSPSGGRTVSGEQDAMSRIRWLVREMLDEIQRLGTGVTGAVGEELAPLSDWLREHFLVD